MHDTVSCDFCYRECRIPEGQRGFCGVRENVGGVLHTLGYGKVISAAVDPVEKKPFYHFLPGQRTLSIALFGCNYRCEFCQNFEVSQPDGLYAPDQGELRSKMQTPQIGPEQAADLLEQKGLSLMSYTYSEPVVWADYVLETAKAVRARGGKNLMVTNGSFSPASLERLVPYIDAFNIDLKGDAEFYRRYCSGDLTAVLKSIERIAKADAVHLEVTTLIIEPIHTYEMISSLGKHLASLGVKVWHLSRFFPHYHFADRRTTTEGYLNSMLECAQTSGIPYIYSGNSSMPRFDATYCPSCGLRLISSHSYRGEAKREAERNIIDRRCIRCKEPIYGSFGPSAR